MELLSRGNDLVEESNDGIALGPWDTDDLSHKAWVEEQRLPTGDRVRADQWMFGDDRISSNRASEGSRTFGLHLSRMKGCQTFEVFLHVWGKSVVSSILRCPQRITATTARWA